MLKNTPEKINHHFVTVKTKCVMCMAYVSMRVEPLLASPTKAVRSYTFPCITTQQEERSACFSISLQGSFDITSARVRGRVSN